MAGKLAGSGSLFNKVLDLIHSVWPRVDETASYRALSRFQLKAEDMLVGPLSDDILNAAALCEEAFRIARRRLQASNKITSLEDSMRDIEAFAVLTPDEVKEFKNLLEVFLSVTKDRNSLRYQLTDFDKGINVMERLEADAVAVVPKVQESEHMQRILKQDVGYIEGEKTDLEYERETLLSGLDFTNKLTIASVVGLTIATLVLGYFAIIRGDSIFYPSTALVLAGIVLMTAVYMFRRRIAYELKLNARKQARAIELLNKKVAVLAHHTNFLNYVYKKYKVRNSQGLKRNLKEYDKYKHVANRLDSIRDILYETERRIEVVLREKKIDSGRFSIEQFAKNIDIEDKQKYYKELDADKQKQEALLQELDARHGEIWEQLEELKEKDVTENRVIETMMQLYLDEATSLLNRGSEDIESGPEDTENDAENDTEPDD